MNNFPQEIVRTKAAVVSAFAQTLRRYTSLNHLAQAARAVLQNTSQINQMLSDLNRVDFANVQWAAWLDSVVSQVLKPHEGSASFPRAARQFLLKWSFYSSMVIRDLTLRSAASFGSFHLIRLLYDEYMFYLVEHRVAQATGETPIAVMGEVSPPTHTHTHTHTHTYIHTHTHSFYSYKHVLTSVWVCFLTCSSVTSAR
ncbi:DNA-binding protein RFX2 [Bagarius yarrelli]|uniref:DNA-binding protein RFX2 n=1 Tax=Bagarius yarrelli TaxID=175774 RepID=A0A556V7M0_BAGYA|nr:DNA-binding protein RFX2 [Bagarius yarrelli]